MKSIQLANGGEAVVDDCDFDAVAQFAWRRGQGGYAVRKVRREDSSIQTLLMHREIMAVLPGIHVRHRNPDPLDNRRENLLVSSRSEIARSSKLYRNNKSGFRGVFWDKNRRRWRASITTGRKTRYLGMYDDPKAAARAYDCAALPAGIDPRVLNFPRIEVAGERYAE